MGFLTAQTPRSVPLTDRQITLRYPGIPAPAEQIRTENSATAKCCVRCVRIWPGSSPWSVLDDAFSSATPDGEVLPEVAVTKAWLCQAIVALTLICRSSYRGVVEFLRDVLGVPVSVGCVHDMLQAATRQASAINQGQDLSGIRVGLHDEIFQGATPVLAGIDAASTYCYFGVVQIRVTRETWNSLTGATLAILGATHKLIDLNHAEKFLNADKN